MLSLRRSALRILSSTPSSSLAYQPRTITSLSQSFLKSRPASQSLFQRRWASDEARAGAETPVSKLQPTPEEEVENAIHEDEANDHAANDGASLQASSAAVEAEVRDTPVPMTPPAPAAESHSPPFMGGLRYSSSREERNIDPKPTIYIGNLFFDVTEDDIKKELSRFGEIEQCRILRDSRGLSKGFGYVDFGNIESATAAINALHQQVFEGRRLVVQYAANSTKDMQAARALRSRGQSHEPRNPPSRTLFIGNMSFEMTDRDLNQLFRGIRNVVDVRVAIDRRTGQPRGFAHADFIDVKSAMEAMKVLAEKETYGRKLRLDYSFGSSSSPRNQQSPPPVEQSS